MNNTLYAQQYLKIDKMFCVIAQLWTDGAENSHAWIVFNYF